MPEPSTPSVLRLTVRVICRARQPGLQVAADGALVVKVREPALEGRANAAVIDALARHYGVRPGAVTILRGGTSRHKLVRIVR